MIINILLTQNSAGKNEEKLYRGIWKIKSKMVDLKPTILIITLYSSFSLLWLV